MALHGRSRSVWKQVMVSIIGILLISLAGCGGSSPSTNQPTPTTPSNNPPGGITFTTFHLNIPAQALNAPVTGNLADNTTLHLNFAFKMNQQIVNQLKKDRIKVGQNQNLQNIANQLGISDATYQKIQAFLGLSNVTVKLNDLHTNLSFDMPAGQAARLFQIHFVNHQLNGRTFYTPTGDPKIPTFIANQLVVATGFDNYTTNLKRQATFSPLHTAYRPNKPAACSAAGSPAGVIPAEVAHTYGYDVYHQHGFEGAGITVNLLEFDAVDPADYQAYFSCVGFQGSIRFVTVDGAPTQVQGESTLDIDMIAGLARKAKIVVYQTSQGSIQQIYDMLQQLINDNAKNPDTASVVSLSFGGSELNTTPDVINALHQSLDTLTNVEHMTVFVASGDCGAFADGTYQKLSVSYPATDSSVVAVGGTEIHVDHSKSRYDETVWSDGSNTSQCGNQWGSGGGVSQYVAAPKWQAQGSQTPGVLNQFSNGRRQVPDVAAIGFDLPVILQGQWAQFVGTSAATPVWAAGMALLNEALIRNGKGTFFYGPNLFYAVENTALHSNGRYHPYYDVTQGNNLFYRAGPGWDFTTGLGTPNMVDFYNLLINVINSGH